MSIDEILSAMKERAVKDIAFREALLQTAEGKNPLSAFCALGREAGYPLYEMDLIDLGEEAYAAMRRSTNGGGENSPLLAGEDDYYELFLDELTKME